MEGNQFIAQIAQGLFEVAQERNTAATYREDLKFFDWILRNDKSLVDFLNSPFNSYKDKCQTVENLFGDLFVPGIMTFLKIIIRDSLISSFSSIREEFNKLADEQANIAEGTVLTPFHLDSTTITRLERAFRRKIGKNVILNQVIDKSLVAGLKVILDGTSYEYSIGSKLDNIRKVLQVQES